MFQTCSNLTMGNQNKADKVVLISLLLTWDMVTRVSTVIISDNDHQMYNVRRDIDPVASLRFN